MNKIKLLWELEIHNLKLDELKSKLGLLNKESEEKNTDKKIKKVSRTLEILDNNKGVIKTCISKYENTLAQYEFEITSLDDKIYKDNITDIKQLEYLGFEKKQIQIKLKEEEKNMLAYMEEAEILDKKHSDSTVLLAELNEISKDQSSNTGKEVKDLKKKIEAEEKLIEKVIEKVDNKALKEYNALKNRKNKPVVKVIDNMCTGCNMKLPTYQVEELKVKGKLINCESCGRILYAED